MKINKEKAKAVATWLCVIVIVGWVGYMAGFYQATGGMPFIGNTGESVAPPSDIARATLAECKATIAPVADMGYGEGWNCLDFAWEAMRRLHWAGQLAMVARLDLEPDPDHAVLIIPTSDEGWVFIEPQTGERIYPTVGGKYIDFTDIKGVYIMRVEWTDVDIYQLSIDEGVVDTSALSYYTGYDK